MALMQDVWQVADKLWVSGVRLCCPNCSEGRVFKHLFKIERECDTCHVKFERMDGESIGGMAITMAIVPPLSIAGYFLTVALFDISFWANVTLWTAFIVVVCTWIYRHSRAAWVAISYLTGGVYADDPLPNTDTERAALVEAMRKTNPHSNP